MIGTKLLEFQKCRHDNPPSSTPRHCHVRSRLAERARGCKFRPMKAQGAGQYSIDVSRLSYGVRKYKFCINAVTNVVEPLMRYYQVGRYFIDSVENRMKIPANREKTSKLRFIIQAQPEVKNTSLKFVFNVTLDTNITSLVIDHIFFLPPL